MLIAVEVASFALQAQKQVPLIILKESSGPRTVAVPIGPLEANAIAMASLGVASEKPASTDLVGVVIGALQARLERVVITEADGSFSALLHIAAEAGEKVVRCASGEGVALAMRCGALLLVEDEILEKNSCIERASDQEELRRDIHGLDTLEFGRFHLQ